MRLVVVGADGVVDMAVPRGRETDLSWPLGRARFLEVGETAGGPLALAVDGSRGAWSGASVGSPREAGLPLLVVP